MTHRNTGKRVLIQPFRADVHNVRSELKVQLHPRTLAGRDIQMVHGVAVDNARIAWTRSKGLSIPGSAYDIIQENCGPNGLDTMNNTIRNSSTAPVL